jgi:hypothetical protein
MKNARTQSRELIVEGPTYGSPGDETAFFTWLKAISCVGEIVGRSTNLHIQLRRAPSKADLHELVGLFHRYGMDMTRLAALKTARNANWFADPGKYWHAKVFGSRKRSR